MTKQTGEELLSEAAAGGAPYQQFSMSDGLLFGNTYIAIEHCAPALDQTVVISSASDHF